MTKCIPHMRVFTHDIVLYMHIDVHHGSSFFVTIAALHCNYLYTATLACYTTHSSDAQNTSAWRANTDIART